MAELVIPTNSSLESKNLGELALSEQYGFTVLAVRRRSETIQESLDEIRLQPGDTLLAYGTDETFETFSRKDDIILVSRLEGQHRILVVLRHEFYACLRLLMSCRSKFGRRLPAARTELREV